MNKSIFISIFLLLSVGVLRAQNYMLTLNLTKGVTYYHISTANAAVTQTFKAQANTTNTIINSRIAFKVTGIRDSLYDMEVKYEMLSLKMMLPGGDVTYTSDKNNQVDPSSAILLAFKNQPFIAVITKSGNLISIKGISNTLERIINNQPGLKADEKAQLKSVMEQSFGESAFRSNFEMGTAIFPSVPIRKNALWVSDTQLAGASATTVHSISELRDITDTFYQLHTNSNIKYIDKDIFKPVNGMMVRNNLEGFMMADIVVDKVTGWVKQSTITQTIKGNTEIKDSPKVPGGLIMPMNMRSDITITDIH